MDSEIGKLKKRNEQKFELLGKEIQDLLRKYDIGGVAVVMATEIKIGDRTDIQSSGAVLIGEEVQDQSVIATEL